MAKTYKNYSAAQPVLFEEGHTSCRVFAHTLFIDFYSNSWFVRNCYKAIFDHWPFKSNDLFKHGICMKIDLPFQDKEVGNRSAHMSRRHCSQVRSNHVWREGNVI